MNALEQEYRNNVERTRVREERRILAVYAIGGVIFIGACIWLTNLAVVLIAVPFMIAEAVRRYEARPLVSVNPREDECQSTPVEVGYRTAPPTRQEQPVQSARARTMVVGVLLMLASLTLLALNWEHLSSRAVGRLVVLIGMVLIVGGQRLHAAWKKRHDAKLMVEWERRLEEMK